MEVDKEPRNSTDPVENASPAPDPETELETAAAAEDDASSNPDRVGCSAIMLPEDGPGPDEGGQKDSPRCEHAGEAETEEESFPVEDAVDQREMDTTPAATPPSPAASPGAEEKIPIARYHTPTPGGYVTPTGMLSDTGFLTRPRASLKRRKEGEPILNVRERREPQNPSGYSSTCCTLIECEPGRGT